jgi:hypothetical protein
VPAKHLTYGEAARPCGISFLRQVTDPRSLSLGFDERADLLDKHRKCFLRRKGFPILLIYSLSVRIDPAKESPGLVTHREPHDFVRVCLPTRVRRLGEGRQNPHKGPCDDGDGICGISCGEDGAEQTEQRNR